MPKRRREISGGNQRVLDSGLRGKWFPLFLIPYAAPGPEVIPGLSTTPALVALTGIEPASARTTNNLYWSYSLDLLTSCLR